MDPDETLFLAHVSSSLVHWSTRTPNAPAIFGVVHRFNSSNFILQLGRQWAGSGRRHQSISRPVRSDVV